MNNVGTVSPFSPLPYAVTLNTAGELRSVSFSPRAGCGLEIGTQTNLAQSAKVEVGTTKSLPISSPKQMY